MTHRNPPIRIRHTPHGWAVWNPDSLMAPVPMICPTWAQAIQLANVVAHDALTLRRRMRWSA